MESNRVSIITPMYNAKRYIAQTIQSVLAQTYPDWEMIIVDDCSTDDSPAIVQEFARADQRIRYFRQPENGGIACARNTAIGFATGKYIAFLDSDDLWKPEKLERQLAFMRRIGAHFCHTACEVIDADGALTGQVRHVPEMVAYKQLLKGNPIACLTVLIDREYFADIEMPQIPHEDYAAWLNLLKTGENAYGLDEVLAQYRLAGDSASADKRRAAVWNWNIFRHYLKFPLWKSCWCFVGYVYHALRKRM